MLLEKLAGELERAHGVECRVIVTDLSHRKNVDAMAAAKEDLDVGLVVAAAGFGTSGPLIHASLDNEVNLVELNCIGLLACTCHFARRFTERGRGGLVPMSSLLAFHGVPRAAHHAATKACVQTLAEGLRVELAALGRRTTVRPGWLSKLPGWSLALLPGWAQVRVIERVMQGMTAHQSKGRTAASLKR